MDLDAFDCDTIHALITDYIKAVYNLSILELRADAALSRLHADLLDMLDRIEAGSEKSPDITNV